MDKIITLNESEPVIDKLNEVIITEELPQVEEIIGEDLDKPKEMGKPMYN